MDSGNAGGLTVVARPDTATRLGITAGVRDALPMVLGGLVVVGILGAALIPNDWAALWEVILDFIRRDRPKTA